MKPSVRNNVQVFGTGHQSLVFAHGFGCNQNMWRHIVEAFRDEYKIILYDLTGSGKSNKSAYHQPRYDSLRGHTTDLLEILEELGESQVNFIGHSVGCTIGILAAIDCPEVFENLFLVTPSPCFLNLDDYHGGYSTEVLTSFLEKLKENLDSWSQSFAPLVAGGEPAVELELATSIRRYEPYIANHFAQVTFFSDYREELGRLETPTILLQCQDDLLVPDEVGKYMEQLIQRSRLEKLSATGHCPHLTHPDEVIHVIRKYLLMEN